MTHTPLPWSRNCGFTNEYITGSDGQIVCLREDFESDDFALIVQAVNNYPTMLEALRDMVESFHVPAEEGNVESMVASWDRARAVLAAIDKGEETPT